jgi:hypothetical protein
MVNAEIATVTTRPPQGDHPPSIAFKCDGKQFLAELLLHQIRSPLVM